jgi:hypothetical protein
MAGEAVASPMRLATTPGRLARPAPPGNDDSCGERRTILEGMPSRPERPPKRRLRRAVLMVRRKACTRQRQARARARNPTWSAARRACPSPGYAGRLDADRASRLGLRRSIAATGFLWCATNARRALARVCRSMGRLHAGHGVPIWVRRKHPSATGAPQAPREGASEMRKRKEERRVK